MSRLEVQAIVLAATLLVAECASSLCRGSATERQGCSCSYADSYAVVTCPKFPTLDDLPALTRQLHLSRNNITSLADGLFSSLVVLEDLLLSWNHMTTISEHALRNLTNLRVLDLSHNLLSSLPAGLLEDVPRLQKLDLSFNSLTTLDVGTFQYVLNLDELSLAYNNQLGTFLASSPEVLSVALKNDLVTLFLDHVNLAYVPDNFFVEADSLRELYLADNPLEMIPFLPGGLEILDMSGCLLQKLIPGSFVTLPFLRVLTLDRMSELVEVELNAFEGLTSLDELSLQNCVKLHVVNGGAFGDLSPQRCTVRRLSLARDGLTGLPEELLGPLEALENLDLQGNPWDCDCHLAWLRRLNLTASQTADLRCAAPPDLRNTLLWSLPGSSFRCGGHRQRGVAVAAAGAALLLAAAAVGGALLWRRVLRRRVLRWRGDGALAPGTYEMLHMDGAEADDDDVRGVWRTETSAR